MHAVVGLQRYRWDMVGIACRGALSLMQRTQKRGEGSRAFQRTAQRVDKCGLEAGGAGGDLRRVSQRAGRRYREAHGHAKGRDEQGRHSLGTAGMCAQTYMYGGRASRT